LDYIFGAAWSKARPAELGGTAMTILVTGANGTVSREVLRALAGKEPVRALVRDKSRAPDLDGVESSSAIWTGPTPLPRRSTGLASCSC
jgi:hypothetical protein